ncbi:DASH family cryptochrome [Halomonas cerina]|uniref:Cryptochrome DASH n=1 Tax=Halomonas cerina TaxID=447424 RepID=A0A839VFS6_9GAMM|nr:DASH family cryptochrome [Halomonas cerina]MBB3191296.1 deoxyribodipyrimidine photo-lyase [Halomonas cerina]
MSTAIVWFRHDLRLADNPLLDFPASPEQLLCVFVLDTRWLEPALPGLAARRIGPARLQFLWQSLIELRGELLKRGSDLLVRIDDPVTVVTDLAERHRASRIRVRHDAGCDENEAVATLAARLEGRCEVVRTEGGMLFDEASLPNGLADLPPSFSAFRRRLAPACRIPSATPAPVTLPPWPPGAPRGLPPLKRVCTTAAAWQPDPRGAFLFAGGEAAGSARLDHYLWKSRAVGRYRQTRNGLMGPDFSTRLSPWLAHGCLSARQVHDAILTWEAEYGANESTGGVIVELLWREYFHWVACQAGGTLHGRRDLPAGGDRFRAWCRGDTGVPFVDAGMCELVTTGWLSNRARQNVASFLAHDLGIDWRLGAAWFEHCLVDYDVASNWGNWGYLAGAGRDCRPHRFSVLEQAEYYDGRGEYVACWQPALGALPPNVARHQPWRVAPERFPMPLVQPVAWLPRNAPTEPKE